MKIIVGAVTVVSLAFAYVLYQALVVAPQELLEAQLIAEEVERAVKEQKYGMCMENAFENYSAGWDSQCEIDGKEADCTLPNWRADTFNERYGEEKDRCLALYQ